MNYTYYAEELDNIFEKFDLNFETFHPKKSFNMAKETDNELICETHSSLYDATNTMDDLADQAKEKCIEIWKFLLLGDNKEVKKHFLGDISEYKEEKLIDALDEAIENILNIKYKNQPEDDAQNFAKYIQKYLKEE